ncbi:menin-like isoform X1 [Artemia franciscana]|uniref:Menin n=1 Tax=Artemia franciscana TaxID=6661 RepID=A0AA88L8Q8_ARTSF|nr:hypothetical protein QYM36_007166 [Artemia franciscana]
MEFSIKERSKQTFPLKHIKDVVNLFEAELTEPEEPDLVLLSIVMGSLETALTTIKDTPLKEHETDISAPTDLNNEKEEDADFPVLSLPLVENLWNQFVNQVKNINFEEENEFEDRPLIELTHSKDQEFASESQVKKIANSIWNTLSRAYYKDKPHLQTLFSYLIEGRLDPFGVTYAVVAACQVFGLSDVHLALSEDHTWVQFGENCSKTLEVTWHGRIADDRRGHSIDTGVQTRSWVYLLGKPVVGSRKTEVAALVSAINPSVSAHADSLELTRLHQALLWKLYDLNCLDNYPLALGNLADLEESSPTPGRPSCETLYKEGISVASKMYDDLHVYPYIYLAGHYYRRKMYKKAFEQWANAAQVIGKYNYSRDDEEIYKEFLEISNELIPHVIKVESSGISAQTLLKDPNSFASILRFYDGLCMWEEEGSTPVLHIGWAKPLVNILVKYDPEVRKQIKISTKSDGDEGVKNEDNSVEFRSQKMSDLRDLLLADKMNTHAISLLLTAQSQVGKKHKFGEVFADGTSAVSRPKRLKRES